MVAFSNLRKRRSNFGSTDVIISRLLAARKRDSEGITKQYPDKIPVSIKFILTVYKMT